MFLKVFSLCGRLKVKKLSLGGSRLKKNLSKAHVTHNIFAHNIEINKYFSTNFFSLCELKIWKYLLLDNYILQMSMDTRICMENHHICLEFKKILKWNYNLIIWQKNVF